MPVPQENLLFVERAGEPVLENGARCELNRTYARVISHRVFLVAVPKSCSI